MNNETRSLWISLGAGCFAAFLLYSYTQEKAAETTTKYGEMKQVVVASIDINEMQTIDDTMLTVIAKPKDFVEPGAATDISQVFGQVAAAPIKKGEQILSSKLLTPGPETGIALQVSPQRRAISIPVDEVRGVSKLIRPGDRVDIYSAIDAGKGMNQRREVILLMQDIIVLATGVNVNNNIPRVFEYDSATKAVNQISLTGDTKYGTITIEATPRDAQDLVYIMATSPGNLFFALRNPNDKDKSNLPNSSSDTILARGAVAPSMIPQAVMPSAPIVPSVAPSVPTTTPSKTPSGRAPSSSSDKTKGRFIDL